MSSGIGTYECAAAARREEKYADTRENALGEDCGAATCEGKNILAEVCRSIAALAIRDTLTGHDYERVDVSAAQNASLEN